MTNEYTNFYDWCDNRLGQTLDNKHRELWEKAGKLIISIHNMNIQVRIVIIVLSLSVLMLQGALSS